MNTPIVFLIFNRPDCTAQVFETIKAVRPRKLLIVADGPRVEKQSDIANCKAARETVDKAIDWPCEVLRNYADNNLGCRRRVSSGLTWAFENVEEAIILEDDCVPEPSFFTFSEDLLRYYRNDTRVMMISGNNFVQDTGLRYSYWFSRVAHVWGWATWRRAWQHYDVTMTRWPEACRAIQAIWKSRQERDYWTKAFDRTYKGEIDTWDYQWNFACMVQNGLCISPRLNLVKNIGFSLGSTHTADNRSPIAALATNRADTPLRHAPFVMPDDVREYRGFRLEMTATKDGIIGKIRRKASSVLRSR